MIEYFANPMWQLKKYLKADRKEGRKECARMFALGKIVFDKTGDAQRLQRLGQIDLRKPLPMPASHPDCRKTPNISSGTDWTSSGPWKSRNFQDLVVPTM